MWSTLSRLPICGCCLAFAILTFCVVPISNHFYYCTIAVIIVVVAIPVAVAVAVDNARTKIYEFGRNRRLGRSVCVMLRGNALLLLAASKLST